MLSTIKIENSELLKGIDPKIKHQKNFKTLAGQTFGDLEVLKDMGGHRYKTANSTKSVTETIYLCKCNRCGRYKYMRSISLISNIRKQGKVSCGCRSNAKDIKEGFTRNLDDKTQKSAPYENQVLYKIFLNMHKTETKAKYLDVCDEWKSYSDGWEAFKAWANENHYVQGISRLKRLNPLKSFSPQNCVVVNSSITMYSDPIDKNLYNTLYNFCAYNRKTESFDVCEEWNLYLNEDAFKNYKKWCIDNGFILYRSRVTRINPKKLYSPENCKVENCGLIYKNDIFLVYKNYAYTMSEWSKILNLRAATISERVKDNMSDYDTLSLVRKKMTKPEQRRDIDAALTEEWIKKNHYSELVSLGVIQE